MRQNSTLLTSFKWYGLVCFCNSLGHCEMTVWKVYIMRLAWRDGAKRNEKKKKRQPSWKWYLQSSMYACASAWIDTLYWQCQFCSISKWNELKRNEMKMSIDQNWVNVQLRKRTKSCCQRRTFFFWPILILVIVFSLTDSFEFAIFTVIYAVFPIDITLIVSVPSIL